MKKKATRRVLHLATISVLALLLTACEIPDSLEEFLGWRDKFFLDISPDQIHAYLGDAIVLLAFFAFCACLLSLFIDQRRGKLLGPQFLTSFILLNSIMMLYLFVPTTTKLGRAILPPELTADAVLKAMHWEISPDLAEMVTATWGVALTILLPLIVSRWQIVMMILSILALAWSILGRTLKGIVFIIGMVYGWATFLILFNTFIKFIGENYPGWNFAPVDMLINIFYVGVLLLLLVVCYLWVPIVAAILAPDLKEDLEVQPVNSQATSNQSNNGYRDMAVPYPGQRNIRYGSNTRVNRSGSGDNTGQNRVPVPGIDDGGDGSVTYSNPYPGNSGSTDSPSRSRNTRFSRGSGRNPLISDSSPQSNVLMIACESCGGLSPVNYTNCQWCDEGLDAEKAEAIRNQRLIEADNAKRKVSNLATAAVITSAILAPEAAPLVTSAAAATAEVSHGLIERKAQGDIGSEEKPGFREIGGAAARLTGTLIGNSSLQQVGKKKPKSKPNKPPGPPVIP